MLIFELIFLSISFLGVIGYIFYKEKKLHKGKMPFSFKESNK